MSAFVIFYNSPLFRGAHGHLELIFGICFQERGENVFGTFGEKNLLFQLLMI